MKKMCSIYYMMCVSGRVEALVKGYGLPPMLKITLRSTASRQLTAACRQTDIAKVRLGSDQTARATSARVCD